MKPSGSQRSIRLAEQIQRELAQLLIEEIQDPRLEFVTISGVRLNRDLRVAEVLFTLAADADKIRAAEAGLAKAGGFLRANLGKRLKLRFTPELRFRHDDFLEDMVYGKSDATR